MFQTEHLGNLKALWISVFVAATIAGCGSGSDISSPASTDASRYFGDHPGQEATEAAIDRGDCRALRQAVEGQGGVRLRTESEPSPPSSRCVGDRSAHEHTASWIPAFSTLYAVRGNRWLTIAYADPSLPRPRREAAAAALAREAFRLTAR